MSTVSEKAKLSALGQGINLTALNAALPELEAACNRKIEATEDFKNAIAVQAINAGLLPGVLSQYVVARCTDNVKKKARSAEQLSLLFSEIA